MKKRIGSVLLALALCLSLLPATALAEGAETVSTLNFCSSPPTVETIYNISGGGTATWTPGSNGVQNKLTLNNVTMTDEYNILKVPANTEIVLIGTNKITATNGKAIWAMNAPLKISGEGSLEVTAPSTADNYANYALYSSTTGSIEGSIDVNIGGALTVNGNIRADSGKLSLQSKDAISVTGSMYGKGSITATAGKSLSITNTSNTAVFASSCTEVSLAAQDGDLTVSGTGSSDYVIYGNWQSTALKLHASGNVSVEGTKYSMQGKTLELSGTIPEASTLTAYGTESLTVPAEKKLINNGTIKLISFPGAVKVLGTLTNNGSIFNETDATIQPEVSGNGVITVKAAMDFTGKNINDTGEGYSWVSASKTLTLTNYKMTEPCNDTAIILPDDAKLVLSGENTLNSRNGALIDAKGTLEISGTGSLTGSAGGEAALNAQGALTITDCKLDLTNPSPWKTVICTNGNALTIADRANVSLHTAESSGWGIKTGRGGNFTLGSDAKLVIKGGTGILAEGASVKIAGTLDVSGCANLGANLLRVALNMEGSSITAPTKDKGGIYLYQNAAGTLTGQTNIKSFVGNFRVTSPDAPILNYYKVQKDDTLGLYAEGSTVNFTAEQQTGKKFSGWTATGVTLDNATNAEISFTMPGNDVTLTTNYQTSSSGSSSRPSYPITTPDKTENGSVTVTPTSAKRGSIVTITVTPDAGYVLDKLTVTDKDGKDVALNKKSDTEYTFVMPAGKVEITPSFVKQAEEPSRVFVDVKTGDYFYDAVLWAVEKGITNGTSAETFSPEDPCTRAQIVTFLWRAAGSPVVNYAMDLSDVAGDAYYAEAVRWALSEGITTGTSDHTFSPDAVCTREQAVTFLWRAAGSPAVSGESAFEDVGADAYYARAVAWAAQNGVTNGISQALFGTGNDCTRAQIVTFLYRAQQGK